MAWVYVIQNADGRFYVGMTTNLAGRLKDRSAVGTAEGGEGDRANTGD